MQYSSLMLVILGCLAVYVSADQSTQQQLQLQPITESLGESDGATHVRAKRTLFLKKKLLGAGLLGFGLGAAKGFVPLFETLFISALKKYPLIAL